MHLSPVLAAFLVLGPLVLLHEWGHFIVARLLGVRVLAFSIGFGPILWSRTDRRGVEWRISSVPLGGYVKMLDEREGPVDASEQAMAFNRRPLWVRLAVTLAGPLMNIFLAWVLYSVLALSPSLHLKTVIGRLELGSPAQDAHMVPGEQIVVVDGHAIHTWNGLSLQLARHVGESGGLTVQTVDQQGRPHRYSLQLHHFMAQGDDPVREIGWVPPEPAIPAIISSVERGGPAEVAGIQVGDQLLALDGLSVATWPAWVDAVEHAPGKDLHITLKRGNVLRTVLLHTEKRTDAVGLTIGHMGAGVSWQTREVWPPARLLVEERHNLINCWGQGARELATVLSVTLDTLHQLVRGHVSVSHLSGPIGIAHMASASAAYGYKALLALMAMLSVSLGVLNLLPIPVLDGGHVLFLAVEAVLGKPLSLRLQNMGVALGAALMLLLMVIVIINDLNHFG